MAKITSIGLQVYKELVQPILVNKLSAGLKLTPSKADILFPHVITLANSIFVDGLPSELTPTQFVLPPKETERIIMPRFDQLKCMDKGVQTNYEKHINASTIRTHLDFANQIVRERNTLSVLSVSDPFLTQFDALSLAALVHQKHWFYISGEVDYVWNGFVPLPTIPSVPNGVFDKKSYHEFASVCDMSASKIKPIFPVVLNTHVEIKSGFAIQRMLQYPCVQVHVEWKKDSKDSRTTDTFLSQCALNLLSSSIATSFICSRDEPSLMIGLVSGGYRYYILAFQLNTLDFDVSSKVKNIFWMKEVDMVKRGKFNIEAMEHLVQLFSFIYGAQQKG